MDIGIQIYNRGSAPLPIPAVARLHVTDSVGDRSPCVGSSLGLLNKQGVIAALQSGLGNLMAVDPGGNGCSIWWWIAVDEGSSGKDMGRALLSVYHG